MAMKLSVLLVLQAAVAAVKASDPCTDYGDLGNPRRSTAHVLTNWETQICDQYTVVPGRWYRFVQYNGEKLSEVCTGMNKCGTQATIWMNGTHPTEYEEVDAAVCLSVHKNCCYSQKKIKVLRCPGKDGARDYFVYQLAQFDGCSAAYCAGSLPPCPRHSIYDPDLKSCSCYKPDICPLDPENEVPVLTGPETTVQIPGDKPLLRVKGHRFYNHRLMCSVTYFLKENGQITEGSETHLARVPFVDYYTAQCPLTGLPGSSEGGSSEGGALVHGWRISISNNGGRTFSNQIEVKVIDSVCHTCDAQNTCTIKDGNCFIDGQCYNSGKRNEDRVCLYCLPAISQVEWSATSDSCYPGCSSQTACKITTSSVTTTTTAATTIKSSTPLTTTSTAPTTKSSSVDIGWSATTPTIHTTEITTVTATKTSKWSSITSPTYGPRTEGPPPSPWEGWAPWSACSKPECDYGYRERTRTCDLCAGRTDTQRELCSKVNCEEKEKERDGGVLFLIQSTPDLDATLLQVVVNEHIITNILMNGINDVCVNDVSACCQSGKSKEFSGRTSFVAPENINVASGFPQKYDKLKKISGMIHSRIKVMTFINPEVESLICHRAYTRRRKRGLTLTHVPKSVLKQAITNKLDEIKQKTGLDIQGYLLQGEEMVDKNPAGGSLTIILSVTAGLVTVAIISIVTITIVLNKKKKRKVASNASAAKYIKEDAVGERPYGPEPTRASVPVYYDDTAPPAYSPPDVMRDSLNYDVIGARDSQTSYMSLIKDGSDCNVYEICK